MKESIRHITLVLGSMRPGGAERASLNLLHAFSEKGIRCDLVLVHHEGELLQEVDASINVFWLGKKRTLSSGGGMKAYLKKNNPDAIIAAQTHVQIMLLHALKNSGLEIPVILNEHSTFSLNLQGSFLKRLLMKRLASKYFSYASRITAVSAGVAADLVKCFPHLKSKVRIIPNAVINSTLSEKSNKDVSSPWPDLEDIPFVAAAGRLVADKDFETLIRSVALARTYGRMRLVILGEGNEKERLLSLAKDLHFDNDVFFYGYCDHPYAWMSRASVFVLSSRREGLPMVLIEALACNCPVISTDCPSGPAEILQNGAYGELVPVGDVQAMSKAIVDVVFNKKVFRNPAAALEDYKAGVLAEKYLDLIQEIHSEGKSA